MKVNFFFNLTSLALGLGYHTTIHVQQLRVDQISFMSHSDSMERRYQHHAFTVTDYAEGGEERLGHGNSYVCQDQDDEDNLLLYDGNNHYYVYRDQDGGHHLYSTSEDESEEDMMPGCCNDSLLMTAGFLLASLRFLAHADG